MKKPISLLSALFLVSAFSMSAQAMMFATSNPPAPKKGVPWSVISVYKMPGSSTCYWVQRGIFGSVIGSTVTSGAPSCPYPNY